MNTITIRRGETLQIPVEADDLSAVSVRLLVTKNNIIYLDETENFVEGKATLSSNDINFPVGDYEYSLTMVYEDGVIDILPDVAECDDCELPTFKVCESNAEVVS